MELSDDFTAKLCAKQLKTSVSVLLPRFAQLQNRRSGFWRVMVSYPCLIFRRTRLGDRDNCGRYTSAILSIALVYLPQLRCTLMGSLLNSCTFRENLIFGLIVQGGPLGLSNVELVTALYVALDDMHRDADEGLWNPSQRHRSCDMYSRPTYHNCVQLEWGHWNQEGSRLCNSKRC